MFFTAFQVMQRPEGSFATFCRRSIKCYLCIYKLFKKGILHFLWGEDDHWEGFESGNTDLEEDEENLPKLRAGIGGALEREHNRAMKESVANTKKLIELR